MLTDFKFKFSTKKNAGFTMIELLIVLVMLAVLLILILMLVRPQIARSRDARRKDDLETIRIAFEDYYSDKKCYPPVATMKNCGGSDLRPYLNEVPCDPSGDPYLYQSVGGDICKGYRFLVTIENIEDPAITRVGCSAELGCDPEYVSAQYNYGISTGGILSGGGWGEPGVTIYSWACSPPLNDARCKNYADPVGVGKCPTTYETPEECQVECYVRAPLLPSILCES